MQRYKNGRYQSSEACNMESPLLSQCMSSCSCSMVNPADDMVWTDKDGVYFAPRGQTTDWGCADRFKWAPGCRLIDMGWR